MDSTELTKLLEKVGKKVFADSYVLFSDPILTTGEVAALLPNTYKFDVRRTQASKGRKICKAGRGRDALQIIAESKKVHPAAARKARQLLAGA